MDIEAIRRRLTNYFENSDVRASDKRDTLNQIKERVANSREKSREPQQRIGDDIVEADRIRRPEPTDAVAARPTEATQIDAAPVEAKEPERDGRRLLGKA